jgi:hypothetical protein
VDKENLARELRRYREGGLGGVHVVPIYGAKGAESRFLEYLGPQWMAMLDFTVREAERLDMGVDMTTGTGWCFGGPNVPKEHAGLGVVLKSVQAGAVVTLETPSQAVPVKRAAPGGAGWMINPAYPEAMRHYLERFTAAFDDYRGAKPRSMYHDSYEYRTRWAPDLPAQFEKRRGYRLQDRLHELTPAKDSDTAARIQCDYRETVSDTMIEEVFPQWTGWCRQRRFGTRMQAHGAPANLLDLYALADVPETEMFGRGRRDPLVSRFDERFGEGDRDPLICKFASSAAHVAGGLHVDGRTLLRNAGGNQVFRGPDVRLRRQPRVLSRVRLFPRRRGLAGLAVLRLDADESAERDLARRPGAERLRRTLPGGPASGHARQRRAVVLADPRSVANVAADGGRRPLAGRLHGSP